MQYVLQQITEERAKRAIAFTANPENFFIDYDMDAFQNQIMRDGPVNASIDWESNNIRFEYSQESIDMRYQEFLRDISQLMAKQIINTGLCTKEKCEQIIDEYMAKHYPGVEKRNHYEDKFPGVPADMINSIKHTNQYSLNYWTLYDRALNLRLKDPHGDVLWSEIERLLRHARKEKSQTIRDEANRCYCKSRKPKKQHKRRKYRW